MRPRRIGVLHMIQIGTSLRIAAILLAVAFVASACSVRSISNSGYQDDRWSYPRTGNPLYRGELAETDVLGIESGRAITSEEISGELAAWRRPTIAKGSAVMVIQSGAAMPDDPMTRELSRHFSVTPYSGVPADRPAAESSGNKPADYAAMLRLAAARSGNEVILCYWGILESAKENHVTKAVSWFPIAGAAIPDETQRLRIRLKVAVVDVRSGRWSIFMPDSFEDEALSASFRRGWSDQEQVALLKEKGYVAAVSDFVKIYAR